VDDANTEEICFLASGPENETVKAGNRGSFEVVPSKKGRYAMNIRHFLQAVAHDFKWGFWQKSITLIAITTTTS
jgi:hypothetical protein